MPLVATIPKVSADTFDAPRVIEPHSTGRLDAAVTSPVGRAVAPPAAAAASSAEAVSAADRREHPDPRTWLDQIQKLRVGGLTTQAEQEMKHFRDAYPTYPTTSPDGGTQ